MGAPVMDGQPCRRFFLEPEQTFHRRYEALRAVFVEGRPVEEVAERYGYKPAALNVMVSRFRAQCRDDRVPPFSFLTVAGGPSVDAAAKTGTAPKNPLSPTSDS
jgi:hypothetical protein